MENDVKIDCAYFDSLFEDRKNAIIYVEQNQESFKNQKVAEIKYSFCSDSFLGNEMPSVFLNNNKRFLKKKPKNKDYISYRYDVEGKILSVAHYNNCNDELEKCDCTYYFFDYDGYKYAVPFLGESFSFYPAYTFKFKFEDGKVNYVVYITTSDLWLELYDWNKMQCKIFHYIPDLVGNCKNVPIGAEKSPVSVYMKNLDFSIKTFSENVYNEWFSSTLDRLAEDNDLYLVINEKFSSQYSIYFCLENNNVISDEFEFVYKNSWKSLLKRIIELSKSITNNRKTIANIYVGFVDGVFEQL